MITIPLQSVGMHQGSKGTFSPVRHHQLAFRCVVQLGSVLGSEWWLIIASPLDFTLNDDPAPCGVMESSGLQRSGTDGAYVNSRVGFQGKREVGLECLMYFLFLAPRHENMLWIAKPDLSYVYDCQRRSNI